MSALSGEHGAGMRDKSTYPVEEALAQKSENTPAQSSEKMMDEFEDSWMKTEAKVQSMSQRFAAIRRYLQSLPKSSQLAATATSDISLICHEEEVQPRGTRMLLQDTMLRQRK